MGTASISCDTTSGGVITAATMKAATINWRLVRIDWKYDWYRADGGDWQWRQSRRVVELESGNLKIAGTAPLADSPVRPADELCTLIYTSGTTGMPKGVMHSFGTFAWGIQSGLKRVAAIDADARMLSYLPLSHVAERTLVEHGLLATGMEVFFAESLDTFTADLQRARPTVFFSVPRLWVKFQQGVFAKMPPAKLERLLKIPLLRGVVKKKILGALGLDQCRFAAGGAAPMPPELLGWYARLGLPIIEVYGMTENCGVSHATLPGVQRPGTVGLPYEGVQSRLDPANGEIQVKSPGLMLGYYKEEALTRQTFTPDGWLHTGDKGRLESDGYLRITGRVKDLFKTSKGKYVAPAPIENLLNAHPMVELSMLSGVGQPSAYAVVVLADFEPHRSMGEIAEELDISEEAARSRHRRAHERMRQSLERQKQKAQPVLACGLLPAVAALSLDELLSIEAPTPPLSPREQARVWDRVMLAIGGNARDLLCIERQIVAEYAGGFLGGDLGHDRHIVQQCGDVVD